ncbi:MAG: DNA methyltransferase [Acidithiobacillus ferriphilus]
MKETSLFDSLLEEPQKPSGTVTCLGITFENDEARRAHFTEELRKKLQDPEFRKIEGFPIGSDEDILNLSDPPYYTACPNPWIADFIAEWEAQKPEQPEGYHREPFAADVSEGKNDPIYNAHSYHTKVPHKAVMRYILHYTQPGDIVYDGFCGTGMTGVAAQLCGNREVVMSLGYQVKPDGTILQEKLDEDSKKIWKPFSKLGARKTVLNDLSPAAAFIAYNYNTPIDVLAFQREVRSILEEVEKECSWMYETKHSDGRTGKINYTVWSDVFVCPECAHEIVFWEVAVDKDSGQVMDEFECPYCSAHLTKRNMDRAWETKYDVALQETIRQIKQVPALINYSISGKRFEKRPDTFDIALIEKIETMEIPYWYPFIRMIYGKETRRNDPAGITHVHHFYTIRNLWALSSFWNRIGLSELKAFLYQFVLGSLRILSKQAKHNKERRTENAGLGWVNAGVTGTLYISSCPAEQSVLFFFSKKVNKLSSFGEDATVYCLSNTSSTDISAPASCIDYVFLDPPFGSNLNYSELSFNWEAWLNVLTNNKAEAIENSIQGKGINEYRQLMTACFKEAYRLLKPGRWMTVEFSNTKSSVWNSIQVALTEAGFIVASVSALDKKQGSFKAVTTPTAVKQDLVISAYKPNGGFEERFQKEAQTEEGVWDFVRTHLKYLPVTKQQGALLQFVPERDPRILFDQMVAYYVRKGYPVPISSQEFQLGLMQRFSERDGMFFLSEQVAEYDTKKMQAGEIMQATLFVSDEASAIEWLRQLLKAKPQAFSDINPQFMQQLGGWSKNEAQLDLRELLNQNFISYDGKGLVPEQIHAYLSTNWKELRNLPKDDSALVAKARDRWYVPDPNKAGDLEKLRERALLKEFEEYKEAKKKLKVFRLEAVRAGFKLLWQQRTDEAYKTIIEVAEKIPNNVLEEDPKLLMWYDQAVTRMGGE